MYEAKISDHYIAGGAVFYRLSEKMDMAPILLNRLNKEETREQAIERWSKEEHWLADWSGTTPVPSYRKGCTVCFDINSSTFYPIMHHGKTSLHNIRNINVCNLTVVKE